MSCSNSVGGDGRRITEGLIPDDTPDLLPGFDSKLPATTRAIGATRRQKLALAATGLQPGAKESWRQSCFVGPAFVR